MLTLASSVNGKAGYQDLGLSEKIGTSDTGLASVTQYYLKVNINGAGIVEFNITTGSGMVTFNALITLLNAAIAGTTWALFGGDLRCTSNITGLSSSISLSPGTTGNNLFANITDWAAFDAAVAGVDGYQTLTDVKEELEIYSYYDYETENDFDAALSYASLEAERLMKWYISESYYDQLQAMNKVGLDQNQEYLYWAEVFIICYCFLSLHDRKELYKRKAAQESISQDGVTRSSSGPTGKAMAADLYLTKGLQNMNNAGYVTGIRVGRNIMSNDGNNYPREFN
jgi:hypothetical protein